MSEDQRIWALIGKILAAEANAEERDQVESWINSNPQNARSFELIYRYWERGLPIPKEASARTYQALLNKIQQAEKLEQSAPEAVQRPRGRRSWMRIAAGFAILLVAGITWLFLSNSPWGLQHQWVEKVNAKGSTSRITLPDGSMVWLNADSKLRYPRRFAKAQREVFLEGEAFFEVEADSLHPFIVNTDGLQTRVLGTSFNVEAYPESDRIKVAVSTGKVQVQSTDNVPKEKAAPIILSPKEKVVYDKVSFEAEKSAVDPDFDSGWKEGSLAFEDANLEQIALKLERWYGIVCKTESGEVASEIQFNGTFKDKPLETVIDAVAIISGINYSFQGDTLVLSVE